MKKRVLVLFGGQSSEHEISCLSAANIIDGIDRDRYEPVLVGITKTGRWLMTESADSIRDGSWKDSGTKAVLSPDAEDQALIVFRDGKAEKMGIDVIFPTLHGLWGEDGTVQGIFELAQIPYVGCGVLASAVSMDKYYTKQIIAHTGIRQADYEVVYRSELGNAEAAAERLEKRFSYPVFIKPCNAGSSCGVTKAENREQLLAGLREAGRHDRKMLVEETIVGREIECAVFGGGDDPVRAFGVGEILAADTFYSYDAKYNNAESKVVVNPPLPGDAAERLMKAACVIFEALDCYGLSRVDFFVTPDGEVIFNEINTLPGFTAISMYPKILAAAGIEGKELMTRLIENGLRRGGR